MKYTIRIPAICGDVIPLRSVAEEMARSAATAFGATELHRPKYDYQLPLRIKHLLSEVADGKIKICDQLGIVVSPEKIAQNAQDKGHALKAYSYATKPDFEKLMRDHPSASNGNGEWDFASVGVDFGSTSIDWDETNIAPLHVKLLHLNEWCQGNGDTFFIDSTSVGWIDERGAIGYPQDDLPGHSATPAPSVTASDERNTSTWSLIKRPEKLPGYRWPLYKFLEREYADGGARPTAAQVLAAWKENSPPGLKVVTKGRDDLLEFTLYDGDPKTANRKAIQASINGLIVRMAD